MLETLKNIFKEVFNDPDLEITEDTTAADVAEWDSFNHLSLIMAIEDEFSVSFTTQEIGKMARVGDLIKVLESKLIQK
jgi:acyl carrier protein